MVKKTTTKLELVLAPENQKFWLANGRALIDLSDLKNALEDMDSDTFSHHVNSEKNDFANWVGDVLMEPKLSLSLRKVKTKKGMLQKIKARLK